MRNILDVFIEVAKYENVTITFLEKKIGASKGVLSRAINKNTDIQSKWIMSFVENYPRYNPVWILTGDGPMLRESNEQLATSDVLEYAERINELKETIKDKKDIILMLKQKLNSIENEGDSKEMAS